MRHNPNLLLRTLTMMLLVLSAAVSAAQLQPSPDTHGDFLLNPWDPDKPVVTVFKDPNCGYCIRAIKARNRLNDYNVFVFWAPILGDNSHTKVAGIFTCDNPVSDKVMNAVSARRTPACSDTRNEALWALNQEMIDTYRPSYVPQYWSGGRAISLGQLALIKTREQRISETIADASLRIPWQRYTPSAINTNNQGKASLAVLLPEDTSLDERTLQAIRSDNSLNWYVFDNNTDAQKHYREFLLLTGLQTPSQVTLVLEGMVLTPQLAKSLLPKGVAGILSGI